MRFTAEKIINEISAYMKQLGGIDSGWYVGIATDAKQRLFVDHNVSEQSGAWIYLQATSSDVARLVEKAYLDAGCTGGPGGGDSGTDYVYAYKKTSTTRE